MIGAVQKNMNKSFSLLRRNFFVANSSLDKTIFTNIVNVLFFISLLLTITIGRIYPLNYVSNAIFILMSLLMLIYVYLFDYFFIDTFVLLIILINVLLFFSNIMNGFQIDYLTLNYLTIGMIPTYFYFYFSKESRKVAVNYVVLAYIFFNIFFFAIYYKELLSFNLSVRLGGKIANENDVATFLLTGHGIILYFVFKKHYYLLPFLALNLLEMISTGSRSGLLNIVILSFFVLYMLFGRRRKLLFITSILAIGVIGYFSLYIPQMSPLKIRFESLFLEVFTKSGNDGSTSNRIMSLTQSIEVFLRNPIFGSGSDFASKYIFNGQAAHNAYAEIAASCGIFVLMIFLSFFILPIKKANDENSPFAKIIIISFLLFYFTLSGYYYKPPYYLIPLTMNFDNFKNPSFIHKKLLIRNQNIKKTKPN